MACDPVDRVCVLVSANIGPSGFARLEAVNSRIRVEGAPRGVAIVASPEVVRRSFDYPDERPDLDVASLLAEAEILIASRLPRDLPARAPKLKSIHVTSAGVDGLWQPWLGDGRHGVTSGRGIHAIGIGEFVLAGMLAYARGLPRLLAQQAAGRWEKFMGGELHGRTVAVLGAGAIGCAVAARAQAFGMEAVGFRRSPDQGVPPGFHAVVGREDLPDLFRRADYVVNCLPLTPETRGLVDAALLSAMPPGAVFVNIGRSDTVDDVALRSALAQRAIRGALLDVHAEEPLPADDPLWTMEHVIVTPHIAGLSEGRDGRGLDIMAENLRRYLAGESLVNVVDMARGY